MSREFVNIPVPVDRVDEVYALLARQPRAAGALEPARVPALVAQAYRQTSDVMRRFLDALADKPGQRIGAADMQQLLGIPDAPFRGHMAGFKRLWTGPLHQSDTTPFFFYASGSGTGGTMEYAVTPEVAAEIRRAKEGLPSVAG
jgi:hypothetical protein